VRKVLCINRSTDDSSQPVLDFDRSKCEVTLSSNTQEALQLLAEDSFDGVYFADRESGSDSIAGLVHSAEILKLMPDGVALLDKQGKIIRANKRLASWFDNPNMAGLDFYEAIGESSIVGAESSPIRSAIGTGQEHESLLSCEERFFTLKAVPIIAPDGQCSNVVVTMADTTIAHNHRQKLDALHSAGNGLADLRPEEIYQMDVEQRIDLLKENILHFALDLLKYDVVEIRLLNQENNDLSVLLSYGINSDEGQGRPLKAEARGNGVTGFVVATGNSYLCEDTTNDPLYLDGLVGAKSSLTVPLTFGDQVIGSFNVESPNPRAFDESDLRFMEAFADDIAASLNTLKLLDAQRSNATLESIEAIREAVALPLDEILNDTVHAIESYIGHDPDVTQRLRAILTHAREVKKHIHQIGRQAVPDCDKKFIVHAEQRPALIDKRILVIDADEQVRTSAHCLLERAGCVVETAHEGHEAILMVQSCGPTDTQYDAIIADIRLPDIGGYDLLMQLKELVDDPPLILMTGFGYDPGHSIVKARQAGLRANAVLFKPFRVDQLLEIVESMVTRDTQTPAK
jgi:CheY-like chemotaxis protein